MITCNLCLKHKGLGELANPPGGYVYENEHFMVCHAPINKGSLGTLFIESKRHILDFADFNSQEAISFGDLTKRIYSVLRPLVGAERIYHVSMMEGIPHFHAWIIPRTKEITERGVGFLAKDLTCSVEEAVKLTESLKKALR